MTDCGERPRLRRILVTNDDGIDAPGLSVAEAVANCIADEVWTVAPSRERSGAARSVSLNQSLRLHAHGPRRFSVDGTPTDAVMLALKEIMAEAPPDLTISGINFGANLGEEASYSGTVSAALEATIGGVPAIAMSQLYHRESKTAPWHIARSYAKPLLEWLLQLGWPPGSMMNVNFPPLIGTQPRGVKITHLDDGNVARGKYIRDVAVKPDGKPFTWKGYNPSLESKDRDSDVGAVQDGYITVTPLKLDLTDREALRRMQGFNDWITPISADVSRAAATDSVEQLPKT